jgi:hypothetical protein
MTMQLAEHQRILLGLMRANYKVKPDDGAYFHRVARSPDLAEARGNVFLWRVYVLERTCVWTVALLRQLGGFDGALQAYIRSENISPFREYQPIGFLQSLAQHAHHLVASVSQFELAMMKVREGDAATHVVPWRVDPHNVLYCLMRELPVDLKVPRGQFTTRISGELAHLFEIDAA